MLSQQFPRVMGEEFLVCVFEYVTDLIHLRVCSFTELLPLVLVRTPKREEDQLQELAS